MTTSVPAAIAAFGQTWKKAMLRSRRSNRWTPNCRPGIDGVRRGDRRRGPGRPRRRDPAQADYSPDISVVVVEKGSEVGAHILSGAVIDPSGLDALLPDWRDEDTPIKTAVTDDRFYMLGPRRRVRIPNLLLPPLMSNHGNFIVSLGNVCRWLAAKAEAARRRNYPGFAATEVLYRRAMARSPASPPATWASARTASPRTRFTRGMELRAKYTLFGEGARGQLTKTLVARYGARSRPPAAEVRHRDQGAVAGGAGAAPSGLAQHTFGWPLDGRTGGGSFLYHFDANFVSVGFVVHLNYENPYLSPFEEFQRFKTHPLVRELSRAASASATARAPSWKAAGSRCRTSRFPAAR